MDSGAIRIRLSGPEALLMHQSLGTLVNAIRGVRFEEQIGMTESALKEILGELNTWVEACEYDAKGVIVVADEHGDPIGSFERDFRPLEIKALRNSLEIVMLDLGHHEFSTITGFELRDAKQLLDRLNAALLDPLHLNGSSDGQPNETLAH